MSKSVQVNLSLSEYFQLTRVTRAQHGFRQAELKIIKTVFFWLAVIKSLSINSKLMSNQPVGSS